MARFYISSTFDDLQDYRKAVYAMLRKLRHDAVAMEDYVAKDQRPLDKCLEDVAACDVYIGIFSWRYGYIPPKDNPQHKSITELEYRKAEELGKERLIFLLDPDTSWPPKAMDSTTGEGDRGERINTLRAELEERIVRSTFKTPDELAGLVSAAVQQWEEEQARRTRSFAAPNLGRPVAERFHVVSYAEDVRPFVIKLDQALSRGVPPVRLWLRERDPQPGQDRDQAVDEALRSCDSLLFVMSHESVQAYSEALQELTRALKYKKPILPLLLDQRVATPLRLETRQPIDFSGMFEPAVEQLHTDLQRLTSPQGILQGLKNRLADAQRDLQNTADHARQQRIRDDIAQLDGQIRAQERVVADPAAAAQRTQESIASGLEREREPEQRVSGVSRSKFINPPPAMAPNYFQDRHLETAQIGTFLQDATKRLITVVGRGGVGKTAMVCRLLKSLERGQLPDDGGPLSVDGIVYLSAIGTRNVNVPHLLADLSALLPKEVADQLEAIFRDPSVSTTTKMQHLLAAFPAGRTLLLLDNFEDLLDQEVMAIKDVELKEALETLLRAPQHGVKVIVTTRFVSRELALVQPQYQSRIDLDEGLPSPFAENILREMDADGKVGLREAPDAVLAEVRIRTRGYPRALEAFFAILAADRDTSLREVLDSTTRTLPEHVVEALVGQAFSRLDPVAQQVMQALAIYGRPVTPAAVDYLLQSYQVGINSAPVLGRLVNMQFARKEDRQYYLHPIDRAYALDRTPEGEQSDRLIDDSPPFSQFALRHRAANYFQRARTPRETWKTLDDLQPQLTEFDLRCAGQDYATAADVLSEIDFDYLLVWGYYRLTVELHERLQGYLTDPKQRASSLISLGNAYYSIGETRRAISCCEQALVIDREIGNRYGEAVDLGNLGVGYGDLGETQRAISCCEQALVIDREIGDQNGEGYDLINLTEVLIDEGRNAEATVQAREAVRIAIEVESQRLCSYNFGYLALAYLYTDELSAARTAAESAAQYDVPENKHQVIVVLGIIAIRQNDSIVAEHAWTAAVAETDRLLAHTADYYEALDSKALALSGLALCGHMQHLPAAIAAYRAARAVTSAVGIVGRVLRLFDALAQVDTAGLLAPVREVAGGYGDRI